MRRGARGNPVSLFSFQDVMVSTIGITLLLILILLLIAGQKAVQVVATDTPKPKPKTHDRVTAPSPEAIDDPTKLQLELLMLEDRIVELELLLDKARESAHRAHTASQLDSEHATATAMQRQAAALAAELETLRTRKRVTYLLDKEDADKTPLIIELGAGRAVLGGSADDEAALALYDDDPAALAGIVSDWVDGLPDRDRRVLVFVLRPSGLAAWQHVQQLLPAWSADGIGHGVDLIAEDWSTSGLLSGGGSS